MLLSNVLRISLAPAVLFIFLCFAYFRLSSYNLLCIVVSWLTNLPLWQQFAVMLFVRALAPCLKYDLKVQCLEYLTLVSVHSTSANDVREMLITENLFTSCMLTTQTTTFRDNSDHLSLLLFLSRYWTDPSLFDCVWKGLSLCFGVREDPHWSLQPAGNGETTSEIHICLINIHHGRRVGVMASLVGWGSSL